ncbi:MAG: DEAD/DEAH box helicase [Longimicrobiales bacterium]
MDSFEELGLRPELVEALAAEGIERPTPLQEAAVPVLRRGNNLVLAAGPGAGTLVAWGASLLDRLDTESATPAAVVLTPTAEVAEALAQALARLALGTGHTVAALGSHWVMPARAHVLFGTPAAVLAEARGGSLSLSEVQAVVVDQAEKLDKLDTFAAIEDVLTFIPKDGQRIVTALPLNDAVDDLVERHVRRATTVPPRAAPGTPVDKPPHRGSLRFRVVPEPRESGVLATVAELLADDARHVLVFCRSEDRAADIGDYLTLHGYMASSPGDEAAPVWLGVDPLAVRATLDGADGVMVVSCDVPSGPDELDRRHGIADHGVAVILPREIPHLRDVAKRTGYEVEPLPLAPRPATDGLAGLRDTLRAALEGEDVEAYLLVLEPLFEEYDPAQVAAAATALLRKKAPTAVPELATQAARAVEKAPAWVKVFLSVGELDGLTPGDLLGAITGEAGIPGSSVGRIEIRENHTLVDIQDAVAPQVIKALNGTTIRGRAVRADVDRPRRGAAPRGAGGSRGGGPSRGGPPRGRPPRR